MDLDLPVLNREELKAYLLGIGLLIAFMVIGGLLGSKFTADHYKEKLEAINQEYYASIQAARSKELEWQKKATEIETKYEEQRKEAEQVAANNASTISGLRQQVAKYSSRVSSKASTSCSPDVQSRIADLAERVLITADFTQRCSKRVDELINQVLSLQSYIRNIK